MKNTSTIKNSTTRFSLIKIQLLGTMIRYCLILSNYQKTISNNNVISTPLNSWKRVEEGLHILKLNINPYTGDNLHESPLNLTIYGLLIKNFGKHLYVIFITCDAVTAMLLYYSARKYTEFFCRKRKHYTQHTNDLHMIPEYVVAAYLFNPYIILNCVGYTTTVFSNLMLAFLLAGLACESLLLSASALALSICHTFYPVILLSPLFLQFKQKSTQKAVVAVTMVSAIWSILTLCSYSVFHDWDFITNTYKFTLQVPDLQPNIGLFWYFFIQMFAQFESLFLYALQINILLLYLVPLTLRFKSDPILLATSFLALIAVFKTYPCIGDVGFVLTLMLYWKPILTCYPYVFLAGMGLLVCTAIAPLLWYLWIYSGSANANFYFGVTLSFGCVQILLIASLLFSYVKYEYINNKKNVKSDDICNLCFSSVI